MKRIYTRLKNKLAPLGYSDDDLVFGSGPESCDVMLIGEAPGKDEVAAKKPFVGKAGKNLDEFLKITGLSRDDIYITNVVKFRPYIESENGRRRNRPPKREEIELCADCLKDEIGEVAPKLIVTLGNTALCAVTGEAKIGEMHGKPAISPFGCEVFPLYHPASIIYRKGLLSVYESDLEKLEQLLKERSII